MCVALLILLAFVLITSNGVFVVSYGLKFFFDFFLGNHRRHRYLQRNGPLCVSRLKANSMFADLFVNDQIQPNGVITVKGDWNRLN